MLAKSRTQLVLIAAIAVSSLAAAAWFLRSDPGLDQQFAPGIRPLESMFDPEQPLMVDTEEPTSLTAARNKADFVVPIPSYLPEAVDATPVVWFSESTGEVAIRFSDSVVIEYVPWVSDQRPEDEYDTMVKEWGVGEATTVAGRPAWVVPADAAGPGEPPVPVVHVAVDGVEVTLYGRLELNELLKVADSLAPLEQIATGVS